jgi:thiamine biosynthesis lipoprotein
MNFEIWGLSGTLVTERDDQRAFAEKRLWHWLSEIDVACNRFRDDSDISRLNASHGDRAGVSVGPIFERALDASLDAFEATGGLCDPTVLPALLSLGYDVDYDELVTRADTPLGAQKESVGLAAIIIDRGRHRVALQRDCQLDLGATAKALAADLVADDVAPSGGVVVEIGGDVAVRGAGPHGPWAIAISDTLRVTGREPRVGLSSGGLATSSITQRTWIAGGQRVNHIIDPRTGRWAQGPFATASVSATSCVLANAMATASLLWGDDAPYYVAQARCAARLVDLDGDVHYVGGWPADEVRA